MRVKKGQFSVVPDSFAAQLHPLDVVPKGSGGYVAGSPGSPT
jgi:hypothetical protein